MSYGLYSVNVTDGSRCHHVASIKVEEEVERCPEIAECLRFAQDIIYLRCLNRIAEPLLWQPHAWDLCRARALVRIATWLSTSPELMTNPERSDGGAIFAALLLGEAIFACNSSPNSGRPPCEMGWDALVPFFQQNQTVLELFLTLDLASGDYSRPAFEHFKHDVLESLFLLRLGGADVITVGPNGFDNEPIFAPSLCRPTRLNRVTMMVIKNLRVPSDCLDMAIFPWTLGYSGLWSALFLRDAVLHTGARWLVPGDSGGILIMGLLGVKLLELQDSKYRSVLDALQRSSPQWPPTYPPQVLSKLVPGHEHFAPAEAVVSDDDAFHLIAGNMSRLDEAFQRLGPTVVLKKEFSEAGRGVAMVRKGR